MPGGREPDQTDRQPQIVNEGGKHDRDHRQGAQEHRGLAGAIGAPAPLEKAVGKPAAQDAAEVRHQVDRDQRRSEREQRQSILAVQVLRQPEQQEPPDRIGQELAGHEGPRLAMTQQLRPGHALRRVRRIRLDIGELRG